MNNTRNILLVSTFLYVFLAPFFFHPDIKTIFYLSQFLKDGVFNIYQFIVQNPANSSLGPFVYPPLAYLLFGTLFLPVKILGGVGFTEWLSMGNDAVAVAHIFQYLFAIKLPLIGVHVATGVLLVRLLKNQKEQILALTLWFLNPISIYVVSLMGQFDGVPALLTVLSLLLASRRPTSSALLLGVAAALKSYPLFLLPFLVLYVERSWLKRLRLFALGLIPYVLSFVPFLRTPELYKDALVSNLSQRIFELSLPLGFGEQLLVIPGILVFLFLLAAGESKRRIFPYFLAVPLILVVGSHFHPQWSMWALPFLVIAVARYRLFFAASLFFIGWIGTIALFADKFLTWGILSPIEPALLFLPPPGALLDPGFARLLQSLMHTLLAGAAAFIVWRVFREKSDV